MPQGTFLSNPATAADGVLGGGSGTLPGQPTGFQGNLGYAPVSQPTPWWQSPWNEAFDKYINQPLKDIQLWKPFKYPQPFDILNQLPTGMEQQSKPNKYVSPFVQKNQQQATAQYASMPNLAGNPGSIPIAIANQAGAADGMTPQQVAQQMQAAGYVQKWVEDVGQVWVPGSGMAQANGGSMTAGGGTQRPEYVDGASLAPGESVVDANGNRFVGGTPTATGESQYAINYANPNAARDTKGKYKWVSDVRKDSNGNWVRINRQVLRKVYTRSHMKQAAQRRADERAAAAAPTQNEANYSQLVNLRANYG
jgi:hypothetical protein